MHAFLVSGSSVPKMEGGVPKSHALAGSVSAVQRTHRAEPKNSAKRLAPI